MFKDDETQYCSMCQEWAKRNEQNTKDYIEIYTKYLKLERILSEIQKQLDDFKLKESFLQSQKAQNNFLTRQLNGVFNNLLESDIRVIRGMNKINKCEEENE